MRLEHRRSAHGISQFVLKVHSRCDLACDHCYVYKHADQSWRSRPHEMDLKVVERAAKRIAEHAAERSLPWVTVILHGGEPLLMGAASLESTLDVLRKTVGPVTDLRLHMQTNGVLLTEKLCRLLVAYDVKVGVSLDGDRVANDRHRLFPSGASSHAKVRQALSLLRRPHFRSSYSALLCTIDLENDPLAVYSALLAEEPPRVDFLLPHATWENPPARPVRDPLAYASWLQRIYHKWMSDGRPVPIRTFDSIRSTAVGGPSITEAFGTDPVDLIVIETDGAWEQADSLKTAFDGAAATGFDIFTKSVSEAAEHPGIAARLAGASALCSTCRVCPVVRHCGGGLYAHRYKATNGFDNPSVYCADLKGLIETVTADITPQPRRQTARGLPRNVLDDLASGYGSAESVQWLATEHLVTVWGLLKRIAQSPHDRVADGWRLLLRLKEQVPAATWAVLAHPFVREWLVRCLQGKENTQARVATVAAAVALRAGLEAEVAVPVSTGEVYLPTVGTLRVAGGEWADLSMRAQQIVVRCGGATSTIDLTVDGPAWRPTAHVRIGDLTVMIVDDDPYRACYEWAVAEPLTAETTNAWRDSVIDAWAGVVRDGPGYAAGMPACLRAIVPLHDNSAGLLRSATSRHSFGALCATAVGGDELAIMMVHEAQHSKLGTILDLVDLCERRPDLRIPVGWRPDPRPVKAALQGIYAHVAVADLWRVRSARDHDDRSEREFRRYRNWTAAAIDHVMATGALTSLGARFVARLSETLHSWPM